MLEEKIMNVTRCLMIKTKDQRLFFTHEKNYPQLIEFSKTFDAEISVVRVTEAPILELGELAPAICEPADTNQTLPQYKLIKVKTPCVLRKRPNILHTANRVKNYIVQQFLEGKVVSLSDLRKKFKKDNLNTSTLCNHIARVKTELEAKGTHIEKIGTGEYKISAK